MTARAIVCDRCRAVGPTVDATYSADKLRKTARAYGWVRMLGEYGHHIDVCPERRP